MILLRASTNPAGVCIPILTHASTVFIYKTRMHMRARTDASGGAQ
jgi:hypothetical protein